jgi:D-alanyl-D-alanine dipeptidase
LLLWDAYRPQRAVDGFRAWSLEPEDGSTKRRHYPRLERPELFRHGYVAARSGHSRGAAVDLTLYRLADDALLPMGGGHDLMDPISHHGTPGLAPAATANRRRLSAIMAAAGFRPHQPEWWHYQLADEPHPDSYFDFPIA